MTRPREKSDSLLSAIFKPPIVSSIALLLILIAGIYYMRTFMVKPASPYSDRFQERFNAFNDIYLNVETNINRIFYINHEQGIIHLPISNAMNTIINIYSNKTTARSNYLYRIERWNNKTLSTTENSKL